MRKATAWSVRGVDRSTQEIAEEAARRAGMGLGDWLDTVVAERASEQGVASDDLAEDDKLDAIGERLLRLTHRDEGAGSPSRGEERPRDSRPSRDLASPEEALQAREKLEAAIARFESRAAKSEERTAKAFESVATWIERSQADRREERETLQTVAEKLEAIESRAQRDAERLRAAAAAQQRAREEAAQAQIDARLDALARRVAAAERAPARPSVAADAPAPSARPARRESAAEIVTPAAPESDVDERLAELARRVEAAERARAEPSPPAARPKLDVREAVEQIARRRVESAPRPPALAAARIAPAPANNGGRNLGVDVEPRAPESAARSAAARPSVEALREQMAALEARLAKLRAARPDRRPAAAEAADLKAGLASMSRSVAGLAPRNGAVALEGAVDDLGHRLAAAREAGAGESLIAPIEAMTQQVLQALRERDPRAAAAVLEREIRALGAKIDALAGASVDPDLLERIRRQSDEVRSLLAAAALHPVPVERLERQIGQLADRVEHIASSPTPRAEIVQILRMLSETHAQIEQSTPAAVLDAIERHLAQLAARVDEAVRRPAPAIDPRPIEDLARRVDGLRATLEQLPDSRPDLAPLEAALREINAKLDRAPEGAADSQALMSTLQGMNARLEETLRQPRIASVDPRPIEDLARRIDGVRATVERKADFAPHAAKLEAALGDLRARLEGGADSKAIAAALQGMSARWDESLRQPRIANIDPKPIEELARRIDGVRATVERKGDFAPHAARIEAALGDLGAKLEGGADAKALATALQGMSARLEETLRQPRIANIDPKPIEELARRIDGVRATVERKGDFAPHAARIEAALGDLGAKLDGGADSKALATALQGMSARLEESLRQPRVAQIDPKPIEALARQIDGVRATVERKADFAPHAARLEAALDDLGAKLDGGADSKAIATALRDMSARLDESLRQSRIAQIDPTPIEDLARQIDGVRATVERKGDIAPLAARLEAALGDLSAKLDAGADSKAVAAAVRDMSARWEETLRQPRVASVDPRPLEELARRIDGVRATVERKADFAPHAARLEAALGDLSAKLDRPPASAAEPTGLNSTLRDLSAKLEETFRRPTAAAIDTRPLEDLGRRIDEMRATMERQASRGPDAARLESALREIGAKVDRVAAAQMPLDRQPMDDLAGRIEQVRATLERQADRGVDGSELKAALGELAAKLDRQAAATPRFDPGVFDAFARRFDDVHAALADHAARAPDASELNSALRGIDAKLDRQAASPVALDARPFEDLAQRIDAVRAALERQAEPRSDAAELQARLREIGDKLDRQAASPVALDARPLEDLGQRIDDVRAALERQAEPRLDAAEMQTALREIGDKLDRQAESTHHLDPWAIDDIVRRIDDLRTTMEHRVDPRPDLSELAQALREIGDKLDRQAASPVELDSRPLDDLASRIEQVRATLERQADHRPDISRLDETLRDISAKLDRQAVSADELRALPEMMRDLAERVETGASSGFDTAALERIVRDLGERPVEIDTRPFESLLQDLGDKIAAIPSAALDIEPIERMLAQVDAKLDEVARATADTRPLELAIHDLKDRLSQLPEPVLDASLVEHAADILAQRLERRGATALDTEALVNQISEIHGRLDTFDIASSSNTALERAVTELIEELETTREVVQSTAARPSALAPLIGGLSEMRAEHAVSDRKMENRLAGVQGILEKLADRLARVEELAERDEAKDPNPAPIVAFAAADKPPAPRPAPEGAPARSVDPRDIPDRDPRQTASAAAAPPVRPARGGDALLEPGAAPPERNAAINAHIAAARRAAQSAMAEQAEKEQAPSSWPSGDGKPRPRAIGPSLAMARNLFVRRRRPILLGATAAALTVAATVAVVELRAGHSKAVQKSELTEPTPDMSPATAAARPEPPAKTPGAVDYRPTGAVEGNAAKPATTTVAAAKPAPEDLVAALPATLSATLRDAAAAGDAGAETELGLRYLDGRTVARDPKLASRWLEIAANQGLPVAQYRLAALYEKGTGVARDLNLARAWYLKGANAGNARAMHNLAVLDAQDGGAGKPDYAEAASWFRRAAELGIRDSQFNLAVLSGRGLGVAQDLASSWMWFSLASRQGDPDAAKKRDEVAAKMDAATLAAAEKALAEFKALTPDPKANDAPAPAGGWDAKPQAARPVAPGAARS